MLTTSSPDLVTFVVSGAKEFVCLLTYLTYQLTDFLPYLFTFLLFYFFKNILVPFPGWMSQEATKCG